MQGGLTKRRVVSGSVVLLLAASSASVVALADSGKGGDANPRAFPKPEAATTTVDPRLRPSFALLRRPHGPRDVLPPMLEAFVKSNNSFGANPAEARRAFATADETVFVIPSQRGACTTVGPPEGGPGTTMTCGDAGALGEGSGVGTTTTDTGVKVHGLAPDGVSGVTVRLADGREVPGDVRGNAYVIDIAGGPGAEPQTVSYEGPAGHVDAVVPFAGFTN